MSITFNRGYLAAAAVLIVTVVWMLAGADTEPLAARETDRYPDATRLIRVQVDDLIPEQHIRSLKLSGKLAANRNVTIKSELRAKVTAIHVNKGQRVKRGQLLLELDTRDWPARLQQAQATVRQRQLEQRGVIQLNQQGLANESMLVQADTALANAQAELTSARLQVEAAAVRAPFDGVINNRMVELGAFVKDGESLLELVDFSPYLVVAEAAEQDVGLLSPGMTASARLLSGELVTGTLRFVSSLANTATRTFTVELELANPQHHPIPAGQSAQLIVPLGERQAYHVSPALLVLDESGKMGLKTVNQDNRVAFVSVELEGADQHGVWVYGPESVRLITQGGGFVKVGQQVDAVLKSAPGTSPSQPEGD
ncbi:MULTISPECIES: efflux RND transporter periplasmic adaptor subunit [unclassified Oceanobacter]|jgi:multidrug efflux system membrane fusion protein|uniref:efflux RND transporter periplasmic adaptor subunit n=1 Tax=unclassified Oceanobacter TaxID=2620260 RepID=UPI0026E12E33|nr:MULTISPECIES: efflux RND transporter periplasmic adaptor subunit [unclassified Oceanobacter]MDO6683047.1 efflux RND transporter periplasmic adaptor subunit [Oceanobacter sp. 5_MG-2023]MDP2548171.1 efflux RND transporter periplasmic adaptor subunit [Oceanobacter sp. 4_MG-2023]